MCGFRFVCVGRALRFFWVCVLKGVWGLGSGSRAVVLKGLGEWFRVRVSLGLRVRVSLGLRVWDLRLTITPHSLFVRVEVLWSSNSA